MGLDVERLKLKAKEINNLWFDLDTWEQSVADAATAKALWGVVEWYTFTQDGVTITGGDITLLREALEKAGIPKPSERVPSTSLRPESLSPEGSGQALAPNERWLPPGIRPYDIPGASPEPEPKG